MLPKRYILRPDRAIVVVYSLCCCFCRVKNRRKEIIVIEAFIYLEEFLVEFNEFFCCTKRAQHVKIEDWKIKKMFDVQLFHCLTGCEFR